MILSVNQLKYGHCVQVETFDFLSLETSNGKTRQFVSLYERNRSSSLYLKNDVHNVTVKCKDCKKLQRKLKLKIGQNCRLLLRTFLVCASSEKSLKIKGNVDMLQMIIEVHFSILFAF